LKRNKIQWSNLYKLKGLEYKNLRFIYSEWTMNYEYVDSVSG
jgi:hypothetical protein